MDIQKFQQKLTEVCELGEKNGKVLKPEPVSYTHLTLPTILRV